MSSEKKKKKKKKTLPFIFFFPDQDPTMVSTTQYNTRH